MDWADHQWTFPESLPDQPRHLPLPVGQSLLHLLRQAGHGLHMVPHHGPHSLAAGQPGHAHHVDGGQQDAGLQVTTPAGLKITIRKSEVCRITCLGWGRWPRSDGPPGWNHWPRRRSRRPSSQSDPDRLQYTWSQNHHFPINNWLHAGLDIFVWTHSFADLFRLKMENKNIEGFALEWILFQKYFAAKIFRLNIVYLKGILYLCWIPFSLLSSSPPPSLRVSLLTALSWISPRNILHHLLHHHFLCKDICLLVVEISNEEVRQNFVHAAMLLTIYDWWDKQG